LVLRLSYSRSRSRPRTRILALALVFSLSLLDFALPRSRSPTLYHALPRSRSRAHIPRVTHFAHRNRYCGFARIVNKPILSQLSHSRKGYSPTRTLSSRLILVVFCFYFFSF